MNMQLEIRDMIKAHTIRDAFNKVYPFLKIEFVTGRHNPGEPTAATDLIHDDLLLGQISSDLKKGSIVIDPGDTVAFIEQTFQERFGLPVQVFRKQKNNWIETTKTDQLTLARQNEIGKEASAPATAITIGDRYLEDGQY